MIGEEGDEPTPYKDSEGIWTIAIGCNLEAEPLTGAEWKYLLDHNLIRVFIETEGRKFLCNNDIEEVKEKFDRWIPWWKDLSEPRRAVLIGMAYNVGEAGVMKFKKFLGCLQRDDWEGAKRELLDSDAARELPERYHKYAEQIVTNNWV